IAPAQIRGVLRARTLRASDAGWSVGHGPAIEATASTLIMYLFGRTPRPQGAATGTPEDGTAGEA
ncbi:maleylpyruvate isomerase family mycothiol-dependent enzyme, partial [Clavibacter michiganensis subsp. insidiosus]